jgi:membrane protein required for colicin V production
MANFANFNWVDYIFIAIFLLSTLMGFGRGIVKEIVSLITLVAAFVVAAKFSNQLALYFTDSSAVQGAVSQASSAIGMNASQPVSYAALGISFGLLFAGTMIAGSIVGFFLNVAFQAGILGIGNRLLGAGFGFARGFIFNLVIIFLVQLTPFAAETWWQESALVKTFQPGVVWLGNIVSPSLANLKDRFSGVLNDAGSVVQDVSGSINGSINNAVPN